jgi:acetyltransferase-like isoleucine patch superfamily enzyme
VPALRRLAARLRGRGRVVLAPGVRLGPRVRLDAAAGARLEIGEGARLDEGCRVHVRAGRVAIAPGARLGPNCVIAAHERVEIGARCQLEGGNVLVDFDHVHADPEQPVRRQGIVTAPVRVQDDAILDRGACVLRGVTVGAGARVLAHAVVTRDVAAGATVAGVPGRPKPSTPCRARPGS